MSEHRRGNLPKANKLVSLNQAVDINPKGEPPLADDTPVSFVPMAAVGAGNGRLEVSAVRTYAEVKKGYTRFRDGDVLFAKVTPCMENGKMAVAHQLRNGVGFGSTEFHVLRPRTGVDAKYICHFVSSERFRREAARHMTGAVGLRRVPSAFLRSAEIPLPDLGEQRRIVEEIEKQFSRLDAALAGLQRVRASLKRYKTSIIARGLDGSLANADGLVSEADRVTARQGWTSFAIRDLAQIDVGFAFRSAGFAKEGIRLLRGENIEPGSLRWTETRYWPLDRVGGYENLLLRAGDIILAMDRPLVTAGLKLARVKNSDLPCLLVQRVARVRCHDERLEPFLYLAMSATSFERHLLRGQTGTQLPHISAATIAAYVIDVPPLADQNGIVAEVDRRLSVVRALEAEVDINLKRAQALRQTVLAKHFSLPNESN